MKRFMKWIALLAMMTLLLSGLTGCGGSSSSEPESNAVSGNWYIVDGSDISTLKLDANGGGTLGGDSVTYTLSDDEEELTLTLGGLDIDLEIEEDDEYGLVLEDADGIYAYRDKETAKKAAENAGPDYSEAILGTWYMPMDGVMQTLDFDAEGNVNYNNVATITYELSGDKVTLVNGADTLDLQIIQDTTDDWILKDLSTGDTLAWKSETKATVNGMTDMWEEEGKTQSDSTKEENYIGYWTGDSFSYDGVDMNLDEAGMTFSIEFKSDGTCIATTNGEADGSATWTLNSDGSVTLKDGTGELPDLSYIDNSGHLHLGLNADNGTMWIICHK
ncbi:MAG: hypothetical protein II639_00355 [Clostridia bacterium]|nr:hypothetical protein [Clostridia bacterium]